MDAAALRAESLGRVQATVTAVARRRAAQKAAYATKRRRRSAGVNLRNARKLRRLDDENQENPR